ncbi:general secretion pathway protein [Flavobacterium amniphilum]|uniref:general secretion pathway protein n=1 Tax=Flavobacterium amniphilum TaxID=1834035 RepID=UPI002029DD56|nr:general secretion pathway protein [Flavobacterium amniphilum]MCL9806911.1 general secretion pathway protein [Flavobacterium amniphilum]
MFFVKIFILICFTGILLQDYKSRYVYWFLYPLAGIAAFALQFEKNGIEITLLNSAINLGFITIFLLIAFLYAHFIMKVNFLKEAFGMGDLLFFIFISFAFAPFSFVILLVFSLIFSLAIHFLLKEKQKQHTTIPLAGYMSLFFGTIYLLSFFTNLSVIYAF